MATSGLTAELLAGERAVHLAADIGWRAGEAFARYLLADCLAWRGQYSRALRIARVSLAIAQELEHLEWQCGAQRVLGMIALDVCDMPTAVAKLSAAHEIAQRLGSATWIHWTGAPAAIALARASRPGDAEGILDAMSRSIPLAASVQGTHAHRTLGERYVAIARAEVALATDAPASALDSLSDASTHGTPRAALVRAQALAALERWNEALAALARARDDAQEQEARAILWRIDAAEGSLHLAQRHWLEARRCFDAARVRASEIVAELGEPALVRAFRAGVDALAPAPPPRTSAQVAKAAFGGLTRRERDAASLLAQGKANRAIARSLGIGERTVEGYIASALAKLGFTSRTQLAVWAAEQGLNRDDVDSEQRGRKPGVAPKRK